MLRRGQPIPPDFHGARIFAVGPDGTAVQLRCVADLPPAAGGGEAAAPYTGGRIFAVIPAALRCSSDPWQTCLPARQRRSWRSLYRRRKSARRPKAEVEVWSSPSADTLQEAGQVYPPWRRKAASPRIFVASRDGTLDNVRGDRDDPHRVEAWQQYLDSGRTFGCAHWARSSTDVDQTQASKAAGAVTAYHQTLGWGRTEVTVHVEIDGVQYARRLDIADNDPAVLKGVEVKTGYQTLTTGKMAMNGR